MSISLGQAVYLNTNGSWFASRFYRSMRAIREEKGYLRASVAVSTAAIAVFYTIGFSSIGLEGIGLTLKAAAEEEEPFAKMSFMGNGGSWFLQVLASSGFCINFITKLNREGEFINLRSVIKKWIQEHAKEKIENNPKYVDKLYARIVQTLKEVSSQSLWRKNEFSIRLKALQIVQEYHSENSQLQKDREMKEIFERIDSDLNKNSVVRQIYEGQKFIWKTGYWEGFKSLIGGVVLPAALTASAGLDFVGVVGLSKIIYGDKEGIPETGHNFEWGVNGPEALSFAYLLMLWSIIYIGIFVTSRKVYNISLQQLQPGQQKHLRGIAEEDLQAIASGALINSISPLESRLRAYKAESV